MAIKKSEIYSTIWESCNNLRGGMDASLYKDYVLFMLFLKYVSDKFANAGKFPLFTVPKGSSFEDVRALKGNPHIGDLINKQIIRPLIEQNPRILARTDFPDFNDSTKLGDGPEKVDRLSSLIAVFENRNLDFSRNRADNDDLLGDAYEFLMRHFATESGKSKGQFYTPAEVSRVIAQVIGIDPARITRDTSAYDPACGSGSLLLKIAAQAGRPITLEGQEKDVMTAGLARMNMLLHGVADAAIETGNTLANPKFLDNGQLRAYDFVVANPPFSDKKWSLGLNPANEPYHRFSWGAPPDKQGDYAYLLHIIRSMKSTGKGACILPHGVLFRGNAEAAIREQLVKSGYLRGIIGLPPNLFYGTGIPACIIVLDKENAVARKGVFMLDASKDFIKDGSKNRLRERDIHKIVSVFSKMRDVPGYARMVSIDEIASPKNSYNLNLPRYIDSAQPEDLHSLDAHLNGGIPNADIDALQTFWQALPSLRGQLFRPVANSERSRLAVDDSEIKKLILADPAYDAWRQGAHAALEAWKNINIPLLRQFESEDRPRGLIRALSESILARFKNVRLLDPYALYQALMDFWNDSMQDDFYQIASDGWKAGPVLEKKGKKSAWHCDLVPRQLIIDRYFSREEKEARDLAEKLDAARQDLDSLLEENSGEDGVFNELDAIKKTSVSALLQEIADEPDRADNAAALAKWLALDSEIASLKKRLAAAEAALDKMALDKYAQLSGEEIKDILIYDKWLPVLDSALENGLETAMRTLENRLLELAERYAAPLPALEADVQRLSALVNGHLKKMGFVWE